VLFVFRKMFPIILRPNILLYNLFVTILSKNWYQEQVYLNFSVCRSKFVLSIDLDEFLVLSNKSETISEFITKLDESIGGVQIRSRFVDFDLSAITDQNRSGQVFLDEHLFPFGQRSKMLVRPEAVEKLGVHEVFLFSSRERFSELKISAEICQLYHKHHGYFLPDKKIYKSVPMDDVFPVLFSWVYS